MPVRILILGAAAGGGYPQWNCRCELCERVRHGTARARTQSSIAFSMDGQRWLLVNASPDLRQQILANQALWPQAGSHPSAVPQGTPIPARHTPIEGVLLTDAQIDHVAGLLTLREGCPLDLYCTPSVLEELTRSFPLLPLLEHWNGGFRPLLLPEQAGVPVSIPFLECCRLEVVPLQSNAPPYSPRRHAPQAGDNIGLWGQDRQTGRSFFYAPGLAQTDETVRHYLERTDCLMLDGTFWSNDEMASVGLGARLAKDMGHLPLAGPGGMLEQLARLKAERKILVHINNTNPILNEASAEYRQLAEAGIEVAYDGMEIRL